MPGNRADRRSDERSGDARAPGGTWCRISTFDFPNITGSIPPCSSFVPASTEWLSGWAVASEAYNLFVADLDGDQKADLIAKEKNSPGLWYVALSNGSSFVPASTEWLSGWVVVSEAYDLFVADVNDDGKADLLARGKNLPSKWDVARSDGSSFQARSISALEPSP
jgi:hypothetical protein